jgi:hypothetical protein
MKERSASTTECVERLPPDADDAYDAAFILPESAVLEGTSFIGARKAEQNSAGRAGAGRALAAGNR